ncbi:MAG TPA: alpha/beta hydrolase [Archangium sp.]|uniref:esterase/lipase family protein n=1 Tax=Archangium sp. TaxID=1872627 RepID=UPI002E2F3035|nr:alpha/beta hydrolase [Archangium sp.]HEX5749926.1 alpha/beta hydrolase [Archangium sp.]
MPRRQMVIPGTGGVLYESSAGARAATIFELLTQAGAAQLLRCKHGVDPDALEPLGNTLVARGHMTLAYEPFAHAFPKWDFFDYDWRLDIRYSGKRLAELLQAEAPRGDRWRLVAHSQGGLVVLAAALRLGAEEMARLVQGVCFVGVPFFGTVNALVALLEGTFFKSSIPKEVVRTWPAIYQMLPRWSVTRDNSNRPELLLDATWMNAGLLPAPGAPEDLSQHIDRGMLERARALYRATSTGYFEPLRKLDFIRIVQGNNLKTVFRLPHFPSTAEAITVEGDTLVPDQFTRDRLPSWVQDEATIRRIPAAEHSLLCGDANVFGLCL